MPLPAYWLFFPTPHSLCYIQFSSSQPLVASDVMSGSTGQKETHWGLSRAGLFELPLWPMGYLWVPSLKSEKFSPLCCVSCPTPLPSSQRKTIFGCPTRLHKQQESLFHQGPHSWAITDSPGFAKSQLELCSLAEATVCLAGRCFD